MNTDNNKVQETNNNSTQSSKQPRQPGKPRSCSCIVTGATKMVRPEVLEKRIQAYGGDAAKQAANYVCTESKQLLREGKSVEQIRSEYVASHPDAVVPVAAVPVDVLEKLLKVKPTKSEVTVTSGGETVAKQAKKAVKSASKTV